MLPPARGRRRPRRARAAASPQATVTGACYLPAHQRQSHRRQADQDGQQPQIPPAPAEGRLVPNFVPRRSYLKRTGQKVYRQNQTADVEGVPDGNRRPERKLTGMALAGRCVRQWRHQNGEEGRVVEVPVIVVTHFVDVGARPDRPGCPEEHPRIAHAPLQKSRAQLRHHAEADYERSQDNEHSSFPGRQPIRCHSVGQARILSQGRLKQPAVVVLV